MRPAVIGGWTGDGTGFVGGADGNPNLAFGEFGHVEWTQWGNRQALGSGVAWVSPGGACGDSCWSAEPTGIRAFRVRRHHFTRLSFSYDAGSGRDNHVFRLQGYTWLPVIH